MSGSSPFPSSSSSSTSSEAARVAESTDDAGTGAMRIILGVLLFGTFLYGYFIVTAVRDGNLLLFLVIILSSFLILFASAPLGLSFYVAGICMRPPWYRPSTKEQGLPSNNVPEYWQGIHTNPKVDLGLDYEDVEFKVRSSLPVSKSPKLTRIRRLSRSFSRHETDIKDLLYILRGWYVPGDSVESSPLGKICVVCVHGGGRDRRAFLRHIPLFVKRGIPVLLFDFREHGTSDGTGKGFTYGVKEHMDVSAAVSFMKKKSKRSLCVVLSTSVGATSAIIAAAEDQNIDGIIAENPLTRPEELLTFLYSNALQYSLGPDYSKMAIWKWYGRLLVAVFLTRIGALKIHSLWPDHRGAVDVVHKISPRPILVIHGDNDTIIPCSQGIRVSQAAQEPKRMWLVKGGSHCQLYDRYPEEYEAKVLELLQMTIEARMESSLLRRNSL